jgi:large subunit ribosomal protein L23
MSLFDRFKKSKEAKEEALKKATAALPKAAAKSDKKEKAAKKTDKAAEKTTEKAGKPAKKARTVAPTAHRVLIRPIVTEKATITGTYYFEVAADSNKAEIRKAVKELYGVTPAHVRVMNVRGKQVRWNYQLGERSDWKKAVVRLKAGDSINVYEGT